MRCALIVGLICFFMLGLWLNVPQAVLAVNSLSFTKNHQEMSIQCFANFWVFPEGSTPRRGHGGTIRMDDVDCFESALPLCSRRAAGAHSPRAHRKFRPWRLPVKKRDVGAT